MEPRHCKRGGCPHTIDEEKRSDAVYHSPECGWKDRNRKKRQENKVKREIQRKLDRNNAIIKDLYKQAKLDVSTEILEVMGFDFEFYTNVVKTDLTTKTSVVKLYEFQLTFKGGRCQIKKLLL